MPARHHSPLQPQRDFCKFLPPVASKPIGPSAGLVCTDLTLPFAARPGTLATAGMNANSRAEATEATPATETPAEGTTG